MTRRAFALSETRATFDRVALHNHLFSRGDLRVSLESQGERIVREVEKAPEEHLLNVDEAAWARALVERHRIEAPVLQGDKAWMDPPRDKQVDVSWDHMHRFIRDPSRPAYVPGYRTVTSRLPARETSSRCGHRLAR